MRFYRLPFFVRWYIGNRAIISLRHIPDTLYLTFDDGPDPTITPKVLEILRRFKVKATFFCVGSNIKKYPEVFSQILSDGHVIGNHGFDHLNASKTDSISYLENIYKADELLNSAFFRPPYGHIYPKQIKKLNPEVQVVLWSLLTWDFDKKLNPAVCLKNTIKYTQSGDIVVFHDSEKAADRLLYVLPAYIKHCIEKGYSFGVINTDSVPK
jgi:peptidoglycan/xylan/chitin deacetylase (PgdA/CDA1 family)